MRRDDDKKYFCTLLLDLSGFLNLIQQPSDKNKSVYHINFDGMLTEVIHDIENNGSQKILELFTNINKFPNLIYISGFDDIFKALDCGIASKKEPAKRQQIQALLANMLCKAIQLSSSLQTVTLQGFLPDFYPQILAAITASSSIEEMYFINPHLSIERTQPDLTNSAKFTQHITQFLKNNTSILALNFEETVFSDDEMLEIIDSINANAKSTIQCISSYGVPLTKETRHNIMQTCITKGISITQHDINYSYAVFSPDIAEKKHFTSEEIGILRKLEHSSARVTMADLHYTVRNRKEYKMDLAAINAFVFISRLEVKDTKDFELILTMIPDNFRETFIERFVLWHDPALCKEIHTWEHKALQQAISRTKNVIPTELNEPMYAIMGVKDIALSYYSGIFFKPPKKSSESEVYVTKTDKLLLIP
jgi:hypothetical protein